jgi:hypothetical protein
MRGCSRCGDEGRRGAASMVLRGGGEGPFIGWEGERGGRDVGGQVAAGGALSKLWLRKRRQGGGHLMRGN